MLGGSDPQRVINIMPSISGVNIWEHLRFHELAGRLEVA